MKTKPFYQSKIVWLSAIMVALGGAIEFLQAIPTETLPENARTFVAALLAIFGGAVAILRLFFTDTNLTTGKE